MATDLQFQTVSQPHTSIDLWIDDIEIYGCPSYNWSASTPTNTSTPGGPTNTPTRTSTPTPPIGATATATPASVLSFDDKTGVKSFPNPVLIGVPGSLQPNVAIDFTLTKEADKVSFKMYTSSGRLVMAMDKYRGDTSVLGGLANGRNILVVNAAEFENMAQGTYYYILTAEDAKTKGVRSKIEKIVLIKAR